MPKKNNRQRINLSFNLEQDTEKIVYNILRLKNRKVSQYVMQAVLFFELNKGSTSALEDPQIKTEKEEKIEYEIINSTLPQKPKEKESVGKNNTQEGDMSIIIENVSSEPEEGDLDIYKKLGKLWTG